jgi:hypothetical protein
VLEWSKQRFTEFGAVPLIPGMPHHGCNRDQLAHDMIWIAGNALSVDVRTHCVLCLCGSYFRSFDERSRWLMYTA